VNHPTYKIFAILSLLLPASLACGLLSTPTPSITPTITLIPPTQSSPTESPTSTFVPELSLPTVEASATLPASQPAAAAHFKSGNSIQIDLIAMISRTEGWGISGAYVLTTLDGGLTWREATPPQNLTPGSKNQAYGTFLSPQIAWVVFTSDDHIAPDAVVWHTTDGGRNWTPGNSLNHQAIGDNVWAEFAVLDPQNVWMLVRGVYVGAGTHYNHELFHTSDAGLTWITLDGQTSDDYTGIRFADTSLGLRTLQTTGAYASAPAAYDVTTDGGMNWENHELPPPPDAVDLFKQYPYCETYQPVLLSSQSIRMLVGCFDFNNPPKQFSSYFYSSSDGGETWQTIHLPSKVRAESSQLIYYGSNNALLLGRDEYISTSDGQTWSFIKSVNWDGQFSFVDTQYGWAVARSNGAVALVHTIDGASTWKITKPVIANN
jgi:photosystem II stability/assembly factor-like uncharacterized protein